MPDSGLKDKVAIVTGAGSRGDGIGNGRAAAILLAREGARVALLDAERDWAEATKAMIDQEGGTSMVLVADVADAASCAQAVKATVDAWGRLDVLVNNVGIGGPAGNAVEVDPEAWDVAMRINVKSMMLMAKAAIPEMQRQGGGAIVNIASIDALKGGNPSLFYSTSKGAIVNMTRSMAVHHGPDGIRVNCVTPGLVQTDITGDKLTPQIKSEIATSIPLNRLGEASDIAGAYLFLASDYSSYITGAVIDVNGGMLIHG